MRRWLQAARSAKAASQPSGGLANSANTANSPPIGANGAFGTGVEGQDWEPKEPTLRTDKTDRSHRILGGVPGAWGQGVADLLAMPPHPAWEPEQWEVLHRDAYSFLHTWAAQVHRLGWTELDLFAVHRTHPWARLDSMGLVPLLGGRSIAAMTGTEAAIKTATGGTLTFYRRKPPYPGEVCLVWDLK